MRLASRLAIVPFAALFLDGMAVPPDFMERNERGSLRAQLYYQAGMPHYREGDFQLMRTSVA